MTKDGAVLAPGKPLRGLVAFAVPAGAREVWMKVESAYGLATTKQGMNGSFASSLGDLPAFK